MKFDNFQIWIKLLKPSEIAYTILYILSRPRKEILEAPEIIIEGDKELTIDDENLYGDSIDFETVFGLTRDEIGVRISGSFTASIISKGTSGTWWDAPEPAEDSLDSIEIDSIELEMMEDTINIDEEEVKKSESVITMKQLENLATIAMENLGSFTESSIDIKISPFSRDLQKIIESPEMKREIQRIKFGL